MKKQSKNNILAMVESNFAAAGLAEGDRETARRFLANEPASPLWAKIKQAFRSIEVHFAAAGLAEGSVEIAREYIEKNSHNGPETVPNGYWFKMKQWLKEMETTYAAAGMAEGDPDLALAYLKKNQVEKPKLRQFLVKTGLSRVKFRYGIAVV